MLNRLNIMYRTDMDKINRFISITDTIESVFSKEDSSCTILPLSDPDDCLSFYLLLQVRLSSCSLCGPQSVCAG